MADGDLHGIAGPVAARADDERVRKVFRRVWRDVFPNAGPFEFTEFGGRDDYHGIDGYLQTSTDRISVAIRCQEIDVGDRVWSSFTPRESIASGGRTELAKYKAGEFLAGFCCQAYIAAPWEVKPRVLKAGVVKTSTLFNYLLEHEGNLDECPRQRHDKSGAVFRVCWWHKMLARGLRVKIIEPVDAILVRAGIEMRSSQWDRVPADIRARYWQETNWGMGGPASPELVEIIHLCLRR